MIIEIINEVIMDVLQSSAPTSLSNKLHNDILESVVDGPAKQDDSLGISEESVEYGHDLPCSEDFEFLMNIVQTEPPFSPGSQTYSSLSTSRDGPTPPTSQDSLPSSYLEDSSHSTGKKREDEHGSSRNEDRGVCSPSPLSQGVYLHATQVPVLTQKPALLNIEDVLKVIENQGDIEDDQKVLEKEEYEIEYDYKVLEKEVNDIKDDLKVLGKEESDDEVDIEGSLGLNDDHDNKVGFVGNIESSSDEEDDRSALPLTFNCRADLDRKLLGVDLAASSKPTHKHKIKSEPAEPTKKIKVELLDNPKSKESFSHQADRDDKDQSADDDNNASRDVLDCSESIRRNPEDTIRISHSWTHLLNKPPRLGLSRLQRKVDILHEVTILEAEE